MEIFLIVSKNTQMGQGGRFKKNCILLLERSEDNIKSLVPLLGNRLKTQKV